MVVPCADCPTEVYVVNSGTTAGAAGQDREVSAWCDPVSGAQVAVVTIWDSAAPAGTAPTVEAYSLDGMPYAGVVSALAKCSPSPGADIETLDQLVCVGGVSYTHTAFVNTATLAQVGSLWRNASGFQRSQLHGSPDRTGRRHGHPELRTRWLTAALTGV